MPRSFSASRATAPRGIRTRVKDENRRLRSHRPHGERPRDHVRVLCPGSGMDVVTFGNGRKALRFGAQKINLQKVGRESTLVADKPTSGSGDVCFVTSMAIEDVLAHLTACGVKPIAGPLQRDGARGPMMSIYFRDPDMNLLEVSRYSS